MFPIHFMAIKKSAASGLIPPNSTMRSCVLNLTLRLAAEVLRIPCTSRSRSIADLILVAAALGSDRSTEASWSPSPVHPWVSDPWCCRGFGGDG
jgi:hypothetical protein